MGLPFAIHALLAGSTALVVTCALFGWGRRRATVLAAYGGARTAANARPPSIESPATIAFLGDVQKGIRVVARPVVAALAREQARFLVSSGDLASHGEAPYHGIVGRAFDRAGLSIPFLVAVGNHDVQPSRVRDPLPGRRLFEAVWGPRNWVATVGPLVILGCDNGGEWLDDGQHDWMERELGARPDRPWLLVMHRSPRHPLKDGHPAEGGTDRLFALFRRRPPVCVVSGHLEHDADVVIDGVRYVVNADGGDVSGSPMRGPTSFRLLLADVDAVGRVSLRRIELPRRRDRSVALDQFAVRLWSDSRHGIGWLLGRVGDVLVRPFAGR